MSKFNATGTVVANNLINLGKKFHKHLVAWAVCCLSYKKTSECGDSICIKSRRHEGSGNQLLDKTRKRGREKNQLCKIVHSLGIKSPESLFVVYHNHDWHNLLFIFILNCLVLILCRCITFPLHQFQNTQISKRGTFSQWWMIALTDIAYLNIMSWEVISEKQAVCIWYHCCDTGNTKEV